MNSETGTDRSLRTKKQCERRGRRLGASFVGAGLRGPPVDFDVILRNGQDRSLHVQNTIYRVGRGLAPAAGFDVN